MIESIWLEITEVCCIMEKSSTFVFNLIERVTLSRVLLTREASPYKILTDVSAKAKVYDPSIALTKIFVV